MLDQPNTIIPLIGVSDELFVDHKQVSGLSWPIINAFRKKIQPFGAFRFIYFYRNQQNEIYHTLTQLGLRFCMRQYLLVGNSPSEQAFKECASACEFVHAPTLCEEVQVPLSVRSKWSPEEFTAMLSYFVDSGVPFSKETALRF